jgi:1-acyl-sn-glycerol-3-phosphate acyltransferase
VNAEIARRLAEGDPVVLFGEGTSGDGNRVLPFRTALIGSARDALAAAEHARRVWIQPLSLAYTRLHGLPMGRQHRPLAAWYGNLDLVPHLLGVARCGAVDVVVTWGEPVAYEETSERKTIAKLLESSVRRLTALALRGRPGDSLSGGPGRGSAEDARQAIPAVPGPSHSFSGEESLNKRGCDSRYSGPRA